MPTTNKKSTNNIPTILVIFGVTGDLVKKKILPALFSLSAKNKLPTMFKVVGFSRGDFSNEDFEKHIFEATAKYRNADAKTCGAFCELFSYKQGLFENMSDFRDLEKYLKTIDNEWGVCTNKLFYLAVPPSLYGTIFKNLAASELTKPCGPKEGWTRVLVEKPFGNNLKTAEQLEMTLNRLFKEIQIYRIDHYLAKEMLQNILTFRFSNNLFELNWGKELIEKVHIRLLEKIGVEDRGSFYDGVGALQDVGQNHLLQMLALTTMEHPIIFSPDTIRKNRADILAALIAPSKEEIETAAFRAQYAGYRDIQGVVPDSQTETYFKIRAFLSNPKWLGVPFILESGKRLKDQRKEIEITFRHPAPCLCPKEGNIHYKNKLIINLEPEEGITISFWSKKKGLAMELEERMFDFRFRNLKETTQYTEEYEKLLLDCIAGDQTLFVSSDEVKSMWTFIDPTIAAWQKNLILLQSYDPDTDEALAASKFVEDKPILSKLIKKEIAIIGLGKMGGNLARRLVEKSWRVVGFNKRSDVTKNLEKEGLVGAYSLKETIKNLTKPRIVWLMVPAGKAVDAVIFENDGLLSCLQKGDIIIDGGNSFYEDTKKRSGKLEKSGIHFLDVGVSGGPGGARNGATLMVGGSLTLYEELEELFQDLAVPEGYGYMGKSGAGHFVKMIHNGIEYGMMQAIAEGFAVLKKSPYQLDLKKIAKVYNHGSVIESRLVGWLANAFVALGEDLKAASGSVGHTGEGKWTIQTAKKLNIPIPVIKEAFKFRVESAEHPSYIGQILTALRNQFGGHNIKP